LVCRWIDEFGGRGKGGDSVTLGLEFGKLLEMKFGEFGSRTWWQPPDGEPFRADTNKEVCFRPQAGRP